MHRWNYTAKEISNNRFAHRCKTTTKMPDDVIGIEDWNWYDGICCYEDKQKNRYSVRAHKPIAKDEICKYWKIYKVKCIRDWEWTFEYHYEILSERDDA